MAKTVTVFSRARAVCEQCSIADTMWTRLRGLMGRRGLEPGEGLLLRPSGSVHTCFMRFAIDVVFLDRELRVLAVSPAVRPWRLCLQRGARAVLELPAGDAERVGISPGDQLTIRGSATNDEKEKIHALA
jgi:uncharacterized protein